MSAADAAASMSITHACLFLAAAIAVALCLRLHLLGHQQPLPWEAGGAQPVDGTNGTVLLLRSFLSEAEVQHVLHAGYAALRRLPSYANGRPIDGMYASTELPPGDDPVLSQLDERIASLTGLPVHGHEGTFRVALSQPWPDSGDELQARSAPPSPHRLLLLRLSALATKGQSQNPHTPFHDERAGAESASRHAGPAGAGGDSASLPE